MKQLQKDFGAFRAKLAALAAIGLASSVLYEKRDDPSIKSVADAIDKIATAFDEYKKTNDARIEAIKAGNSTADFDAKLAKMDEHIGGLTEMKSKLEKMETKLARPGNMGGGRQEGESQESTEYRHAFLDWMRSPGDNERQQKAAATYKALEAKSKAESRETRSAQVITSTGAAGG